MVQIDACYAPSAPARSVFVCNVLVDKLRGHYIQGVIRTHNVPTILWLILADIVQVITHRAGTHQAVTHHDLNAVALRAFIFHSFSMTSIICHAELIAGFGTKLGSITVVKKSLRLAEC